MNLEDWARKYCEINRAARQGIVTGIMQTIVDRHKKVNERLGLNEENQWRKHIAVEKTHDDICASMRNETKCAYFLLKLAGAETWTADFAEMSVVNHKGVKQKLSRVVSKVLKSDMAKHYIELIMQDSSWNPNNFIQKFGEKVKQNGGVWISTNPFDLMTPSNHSNFRSCHSVDGEYSQSALMHAGMPHSFQIITTSGADEFVKNGRVWAFFQPDEWYGRCSYYGTMSQCEMTAVDNYIKTLSEFSEDTYFVNFNDNSNYFGYFDGFDEYFGRGDSELNIHPPICVSCGNEWDHSDREYPRDAVCDDCAPYGDEEDGDETW